MVCPGDEFTDRFGNVRLESPTQHAESVRHVARMIRKSCLGQLTNLACRKPGITLNLFGLPKVTPLVSGHQGKSLAEA